MVYVAAGAGAAAERAGGVDVEADMMPGLTSLLHDFHFLRPLWLLALPLLWALVFWLARRSMRSADWSNVIDADLLPALRLDGHDDGLDKDGGRSRRKQQHPWPWLALAWSLAVLALAGPSWQQTAAPAYRASSAWVLVLDLSPSMAAADLAPNRAARARYAIDDLLSAAHDARVGLVAFSDEPYTVTPLTQDVATVRALLPSLSPDIMPSPGDHLTPALEQAQKLLQASGAADQHIVVLSDGFDDPAAALKLASTLKGQGIAVSVIGTGTAGGAPVRDANGHFTQDAQGRPVLARLDVDVLRQLAQAGGGAYADVGNLTGLIGGLQPLPQRSGETLAAQGTTVPQWRDAGAFLLPLLLLLVALLTRRNWL
jgi:Ca-activated chloride channel family protein